jgi:hypothetical protein
VSQASGSEPRVLLDPTGERELATRAALPRLESLDGRTVGLLDISKARGDLFLDRLESHLRERGANVKRYRKPTFTKPAPRDLRQQIAVECDAMVEALAD